MKNRIAGFPAFQKADTKGRRTRGRTRGGRGK